MLVLNRGLLHVTAGDQTIRLVDALLLLLLGVFLAKRGSDRLLLG